MSSGSLTPLQDRILLVLSGVGGDWTLTGGGALAGFHLGHRTTRDLDLLWRDRSALDALPGEVAAALRSKGSPLPACRRARRSTAFTSAKATKSASSTWWQSRSLRSSTL